MNPPWTPLQRRTWLAEQRRENHLLPAPVLRPKYPDLIVWDWDLQNPYKWKFWMSLNGGVSYIFISDYWMYGDARQFAPDGGSELFYVVGMDRDGKEITQHSNVVRPDDAPEPLTLHTALASYWKLDESEGITRNDSYNVWDLSEWSFQEATGGGYVPVGQNNGLINYSADFGDDSGGNALVSFAANSVLAGDFTFSCWFNYNTSSGFDGQGMISLGGTVSIGIRAYDGAVNFVIYTNNVASYSAVQTPDASVSENTWTHAVFVKSAATLRIYLNRALSASAAFTGAITDTPVGFFSGTDLIFGINPWGYPLIGTLDEVACWQRVLSASEVSQLYNNGDGLAYEMF